jgi:hypothetical protein
MNHINQKIFFLITFTALLWATPQSASAFFYEWDGEKTIKIIELPNTDDYRDVDGNYYDVGVIYNSKYFLFLYGTMTSDSAAIPVKRITI